MKHTVAFYFFQWVLITLGCYRAQRLITTDSIYPSRAFRAYLTRRAAPTSGRPGFHLWNELDELFTCPHCMGIWVSSVFYFIAAYFHHLSIPLTFLQAIATMGAISITADHGHDGE
jgi:hypothetical protein